MGLLDPNLEAAFRATRYVIDAPRGAIELRIGGPGPSTSEGRPLSERWAYITADNPGATQCDERENELRRTTLEAELAAGGWQRYRGRSIADSGAWPIEHGWLVLDIPLADALELGRRYEQVAILAGAAASEVRLVECSESSP